MGACCSDYDESHVVNIGLNLKLPVIQALLMRPGEPYRLESTNYRGHFIRHRNGEVWIDADDHDENYSADTTFVV